ncbi:shikimate kinase [Halalkalicoccus sp. NIPERK01]|uniref:shikimate kinase n=1 Tax=Halalkalicoccus sp. NIPERK01 TaxID=3053469 RepID=UPI00256EED15|nr:shikimate kinase [Halalkalicoccus sp. NIPERK01]MDL5360860.1 shikimate kinase [Halalkalicoccus sp. NIPERK01]
MNGRAHAPAAGTILNALANERGAAFAIDLETTATVDLDDSTGVRGEIDGAPEADTALIERCVELAVAEYGDEAGVAEAGGTVKTESEVPLAAGLKSSSAAANATVLATCEALGVEADPLEACRLGVRAAREVGVTVTGAFDDASASMLGGVVVTDNSGDELLANEAVEWDVLVWTPPERAFSADADVERCRKVAPIADVVCELALQGRYGPAMSVNGFAFCGALGFPTEPMLEALPDVDGVSLSGTGPSYVAVGERQTLADLRDEWETRDGTTWLTTTRTEGARTG